MPPSASQCRRILSTTSLGLPISSAPSTTALRVEARTRHGRPPALVADIRHRLRVAGEEGVGSLLRGVADIAEHVEADLELIRGMPVLPAGFSVEKESCNGRG